MNPNDAPEGQLVLRDIHVPMFDWWPPAIGWWFSTLLALLVIFVLVRLLRSYLARRRQRATVLRQFEGLRAGLKESIDADGLRSASEFLRRVALTYYPRDRVAALSGDAWLAFLDQSGGGDQFRRGPGAVLGDTVYREKVPDDIDTDALLDLMRRWIVRQTEGGAKNPLRGEHRHEGTT